VKVEGRRQWLRFQRAAATAADIVAAVSASWDVRDLTVEEPDIDEIIHHIYSETIPGRPD
jgi:ABC-2 type transport system ATP-binding protein